MSNLFSSKPLTKPLKGGSVSSNFGVFDTVTANTIVLESVSIAGVFEDGVLLNVIIQDSTINNTAIGIEGPNVGYFTTLQASEIVTFFSKVVGTSLQWDPDMGQLYISGSTGSLRIDGCSFLGNLEICQNYIKATNFNGDVIVKPNNLGSVYLQGPVNNTTSIGSLYNRYDKGGMTFIADQNIQLYSSHGSYSLETGKQQLHKTMNGNLVLEVDAGATLRQLSLVRFTGGNIVLNSVSPHNLNSGDTVSISNGSLSGNFTINSIIDDTRVSLTTTTDVSSIATGGSFMKAPSNNIVLNTQSFVNIPADTRLSFGATTNTVSGSTRGLVLTSSSDMYFSIGNTSTINIPQSTTLTFGTSGNTFLQRDATTLNVASSTVRITASNFNVDATHARFYDPVMTLANYTPTSTDVKDRGIEFNYYDSNANVQKLGWFGFKKSTGKFTFITDATNNDEVISGTIGSLELTNLNLDNIILSTGGTINAACGRIINVNLLTGCSNTLNIAGSANVNVSASNRIHLAAAVDVLVPSNVPVKFGTRGSFLAELGSDTLTLNAANNMFLTTATKAAIVVPLETKVSFDGTTTGTQSLSSNTAGDLTILANKNVYITTTGGNLIVPPNTPVQFGNATETIRGNSSGTTLAATTLNVNSVSHVTTVSSTGNFLVQLGTGDINLYPSAGNVRIPQTRALVFATTGTANNISLGATGTFAVSGAGTNDIQLSNAKNIDLSANELVRIPTNTKLQFGTRPIVFSDSTGTLRVENSTGTLFVANDTTLFSTNSLVVTGSTGSTTFLDTEHVRVKDRIVTLANDTVVDSKDRGIEYKYYTSNTSGLSLGWFGTKTDTGRFTFYSKAVNNAEVISGTMGDFEITNAYVNKNLVFTTRGTLDVGCGTVANVKLLTGCGPLDISAQSIHISTSSLNVPAETPILFGGSSNSISSNSSGNLVIKSGTLVFDANIQINGTTTSVYSTVTNLQDPIFSLGGVNGNQIVNDGKDRGIEFKWNDGTTSKVGFFGYKHNTGRFAFIRDGVNNNEVFSGLVGDVEFNNIFTNNINLNDGTISGVKELSGGQLEIKSTIGNIYLTPTQGASVILPFDAPLAFGTTENSIQVTSQGNMTMISKEDMNLVSKDGSVNIVSSEGVRIPDNVPFYIGQTNDTYLIKNTSGDLVFQNSSGSFFFNPESVSGSVNIPVNNYLNFGSTQNSIYSDGQNLIVNGLKDVVIGANTVIEGDINITGTLSATTTDFELNKYILPLGTYESLGVAVVQNATGTGGNIQVTVSQDFFLKSGDQVKLQNTQTRPNIDGVYTVTSVTGTNTFRVSSTSASLVSPSTTGSVQTNLMTDKGKDVGIQVNYWSTTGNVSATAGSAGYKTGFFGFKKNTERWTFMANSSIVDNIATGQLGDIEVNKVNASRLSGFALDGAVSAGSNAVAGTNFNIGGGAINATPIGQTIAATGRFTNLSNTVQAALTNVALQSTLAYSVERYVLSNTGIQYRSPSSNVVCSLFSVTGMYDTASSGTMPSTSISDGSMKLLVCSSMGEGCKYTVYFGAGKLITPNPLNKLGVPTKLVFKRRSQSAQLLWDNVQGAWILLSSGCYIE